MLRLHALTRPPFSYSNLRVFLFYLDYVFDVIRNMTLTTSRFVYVTVRHLGSRLAALLEQVRRDTCKHPSVRASKHVYVIAV